MSLYHLNVSNINKANGSSAVASAAYRSCSVLSQNVIDHETGSELSIVHDYSRKEGLVYSNIFASSNLDPWCYDRQALWNKVEEKETRTNARYARDIKLALQKEFTLEQNIELLSEFVHDAFVSEGIIADVNIHMDNANNPHAHIMLTTRNLELDEQGRWVFGKKNRLLDTMSWLHYLRKRWADINNKYFAIYDIDKSITHESYVSRGFEYIIPTIHEGAARHTQGNLERIQTNKEIVQQNLEYIKDNPQHVIKSLTKSKAVFSKIDLAKELDSFINEIAYRDINNPELIDAVKVQVLAKYDELYNLVMTSDELVKLCEKDINDRALYTTKAQLELEQEFLNNIDSLNAKQTHALNIQELKTKKVSLIDELLARFSGKAKLKLSDEQQKAIVAIVNGKDISLLIGRPGTGKSTVMEALVKEYKNQGYNVIGAAHSAVATINLADNAKITAHTLSKWQYDWNLREAREANGELVTKLLPKLTDKDILIIDEMSMVDLKMMNYFLAKVKEAGSKVIFVGDDNQFSAVGLAGASDKIVEKVDNVILNEIYRQKSDLDKQITIDLAEYRVDEAIHKLNSDGRFTVRHTPIAATQSLINDYINHLKAPENGNKSSVIIAYRNEEVKALNLEIRARLVASGALYTKDYPNKGKEFYSASGNKKLAIGERLVFTKNDKRIGVVNGQIAELTKIIDDTKFEIKTLGENQPRNIVIDTSKYGHYDYGYAITAYKSQGKTYDHSYILLDKSVGYESFNVMATRHRESSQFYVDRKLLAEVTNRKCDLTDSNIQNNLTYNRQEAALFELLVRRDTSALAHDYLGYAQKEEIKTIQSYLAARDGAAEIYRELLFWQQEEHRKGNDVKLWNNEGLWDNFKQAKAARDIQAKELVEDYKNYRKYISSTTVNYGTLLKHAGVSNIDYDLEYSCKVKPQHEDLSEGFTELTNLHSKLQANYNNKDAARFVGLARNTSYINEEHICALQDKETELKEKREELWQLQSNKTSHLSYHEDFEHYLSKTYQGPSSSIINKYEVLQKQHGNEQSLELVEKNPAILGKIKGLGIGSLSISDQHAEAIYNTKSLKVRLESFDSSRAQLTILENEISQKEAKINELNKEYQDIDSYSNLTAKQELYLHEVLRSEKNLANWVQNYDAKSLISTNSHKHKEQNISGHDNKGDQNKAAIENEPKGSRKTGEKAFEPKLSASEIHAKLAANITELASKILPSISDKKIEISSQHIKCGSIFISLDNHKKGLWYRFSRENEKGNLFDLIKLANGYSSNKEAINWSKSYLGIDTKAMITKLDKAKEHLKEIKPSIAKDHKVVIPAPLNAEKFNAQQTLYHKLRDNKHNLEGVYKYRDINNRLHGYVARIKEIESGNKATLPIVYTENANGKGSWRAKGFGDNRCLYNEQKLAGSDKPVLIVEGEKTAEVAQKLYPELDVVSWSGGANAYKQTNWSVLQGKDVTIWPDNDKPGMNAAKAISDILKQHDTKARIIDPSTIGRFPTKWDLADKLPDDIHKHQITGAILDTVSINKDSRIEKTVNEYMDYRWSKKQKALQNKKFDNFGEFIAAKLQLEAKLKTEEIFAKEALEHNPVISNVDSVFISLKANKAINNTNKVNSLLPSSSHEQIKDAMILSLKSQFNKESASIIRNTANASLDYTYKFIAEHNSMHEPTHFIHNNKASYIALSLASEMLHNQLDVNHHKDYSSINNIKQSFNKRVENEMIHFDQHNQYMQNQMHKQQQTEI